VNRADLLDMLIAEEGLRLRPYRCTAGKLTIGIGRNLDDVGITEDEARTLALHDIARVEQELDAAVSFWRGLDEVRQLALCSMVFQLGIGGATRFVQMLAGLREGDFNAAADAALDSKWARQDTPARAHRVAEMIRTGVRAA
jgi:lysozyme